MFKWGLRAVLIASVISLSPFAVAQPPETVLIQGQLLDATGLPLGGTRDYRVRFFNAQTGGATLGSAVSGSVSIAGDGIFTFPIAFPDAALQSATVWYELAIDSAAVPNGLDATDVFPDRIQVHSVPFARVAAEAMAVDPSAIASGTIDAAEFEALEGITGNLQQQLDQKADVAEVDVEQAEQDAAIAAKADAAEVNDALGQKLDASALFQWQVVTSGPVNAEANRGYIIDGAAPIEVLLPSAESSQIGDVVRVAGKGAGGWVIAQSADQQILAQSLLARSKLAAWEEGANAIFAEDIACSGDGRTIAYVDFLLTNIKVSKDGGETFSVNTFVSLLPTKVAVSADGDTIAAVGILDPLYISTDAGVSFTEREEQRAWTDIAVSADGAKMAATVNGGFIYVSTDAGATWTARETERAWSCIASSVDGVRLVAGVTGGRISTSADSGLTWSPRDTQREWNGVASSADGIRLIASVAEGPLFISSDGGETWTEREIARDWSAVASAADGMTLAASVTGGEIHVSFNGGETWNPASPETSASSWAGVALSANGMQIFGIDGGSVYRGEFGLIFQGTPTSFGEAGGLEGDANSAIELLYTGSGTFLPLSANGNIEIR